MSLIDWPRYTQALMGRICFYSNLFLRSVPAIDNPGWEEGASRFPSGHPTPKLPLDGAAASQKETCPSQPARGQFLGPMHLNHTEVVLSIT